MESFGLCQDKPYVNTILYIYPAGKQALAFTEVPEVLIIILFTKYHSKKLTLILIIRQNRQISETSHSIHRLGPSDKWHCDYCNYRQEVFFDRSSCSRNKKVSM